MRQLRDDLGMALIWISHDLSVVAGLADRVAVMQSGKIVEAASAVELYARPEHPYTRELMALARRKVPSTGHDGASARPQS